MTDQIAYQEYIQRRYNAFCKTVIRCAALDKILKLKRQWERQVSLDYLMNEKFVQFAASERTRNTHLPSAVRPSCSATPPLPTRSLFCRSRRGKKSCAITFCASRSA